MNVENKSPLSMKHILNTKVETFTLNPVSKDDHEEFVVYISAVLNEGKEVRVKPLSFKNIECLKNSKKIYEDKVIVGIEKRKDGIYLKLREDKIKLFAFKSLEMKVDSGSEIVSLGPIKAFIPYTIENYKNYDDIYEMFLIFAKKILLANQNK